MGFFVVVRFVWRRETTIDVAPAIDEGKSIDF